MLLACNSYGASFRTEINRARSSGITPLSAFGDIIDGSLTQPDSKSLDIELSLKTGSIINRIIMRDGNERGFEGIDKDGSENPFTFGKVDDSHGDDSKVSEFGLGFKRGLLVLCDSVNIFTNATMSDGTRKFIHIEFLFQEMANKDFGDDFKPTCIEEITRTQFLNKNNNNEYGSTIILNELVKNDFSKNFMKTRQIIKEYIGRVYPSFIRNGINITVDTHKVEPHISPTDIDNFYHKIHEVNMDIVLDNEDDDLVAIIAIDKSERNPKPVLFRDEGKEFKSKPDKEISDDDLKRNYYNNKKYIAYPLKFVMCNTQGYSNNNFNIQGSLEIVRELDDKNSRLLTTPYLVSSCNGMSPRYSFILKNKNINEAAYNWGRVTFGSKKLNKFFNQTNCKYISPTFNYNLLIHALDFYETKLRGNTRVGSATNFQKYWNKLYVGSKDPPYIFELNKSIENNIKIAEARKKKNKEELGKNKEELEKNKEELEKKKLLKEEAKRKSKEEFDNFLETGVRESFGETSPSDEDKKIETVIETLQQSSEQLFPDKNLELGEIVVNDTTSSDESDTKSVRSNTSKSSSMSKKEDYSDEFTIPTEAIHELYLAIHRRTNGGGMTFLDQKGEKLNKTKNGIVYKKNKQDRVCLTYGKTSQYNRENGGDYYGGNYSFICRIPVSSAKIQTLKERLLGKFFLETCEFTKPFPKAGTEHFTTHIDNIRKVMFEFIRLINSDD